MAKLIALGGMLLAPFLIAVCAWMAIHALVAGEPLDGGDWLGIAIYGGLPLVVLAIGFAAWRDLRRAAASSWLARAAAVVLPILWAAAIGAGCLAGRWLAVDRLESLASHDQVTCERLFGHGGLPGRCLELARACRRSELDLGAVDFPMGVPPPGAWPEGVRIPELDTSRAEVLCLHARRAELGE
ncbi:MAG TPA: hypothetical protein PK668_01910 [Myxococcota bacterium]|nr:hypothetical protein [Myxococcota bacterium]HRY94677.1 hypothetical protein [Myxococcota bacterium]HSA22090.1 hypothetical protein [Myxococcota bacterium]